jgi:hypothetical protein
MAAIGKFPYPPGNGVKLVVQEPPCAAALGPYAAKKRATMIGTKVILEGFIKCLLGI